MSLTSWPFPGFGGGLNLRDQPDTVRPDQAVDLLDVTFTESGAVRTRDGFAAVTGSELTNQPDSCAAYYKLDGTSQLVVGNGAKLTAIGSDGSVVASSTASTSSHYFTRFGGPAGEFLYAANGTDAAKKWDGSAWSAPAFTGGSSFTLYGKGKYLAVFGGTVGGNRMVNACWASSTTAGQNVHSVRFSAAGDPLTWSDNDYVDLTPGDGEQIMGVVAWRDYVFVFKQTKFFVFYGISTTGSGTSVFNYRIVDAGVGLVASKAVCAGRDGVYFMGEHGVYRTQGSEPVLVSDAVTPLFDGTVGPFYKGSAINRGASTAAMVFHNELVYLAVPTGTSTSNDRLLVFSPVHNWWSVWSVGASCLASWRLTGAPVLAFGYATGLNYVGKIGPAYTSDAGTGFTARWQSGWFDLGEPSRKTVRETVLWGVGSLSAAYGSNYSAPFNQVPLTFTTSSDTWGSGASSDTWGDGSSSDVWGSTPLIAPKVHRNAARGSVFSLYLGSRDSSPWGVYRASLRVRQSSGTRPF